MTQSHVKWKDKVRFTSAKTYYRIQFEPSSAQPGSRVYNRIMEPWSYVGRSCQRECFEQYISERLKRSLTYPVQRLSFPFDDAICQFFTWEELQAALPYLSESLTIGNDRSMWDADSCCWRNAAHLHQREDEKEIISAVYVRQELSDLLIEKIASHEMIKALDLSHCLLTRSVFKRLVASLPQLRILRMASARVKEPVADLLNEWSLLEELDLRDCRIEVWDFGGLSQMSELRCIDLGGTRIEKLPIDQLSNLIELECFRAYGIPCSTGDFVTISKLPRLRELGLFDTGLHDDFAKSLRGMKKLERLSIGGCRITNRSLEHCDGNSSLRELGLTFNEITDAGLPYLQTTQLKKIGFRGTSVTRRGLCRFEESLPECNINMDRVW